MNGICKVCDILENDLSTKVVKYCKVCKANVCKPCTPNILRRAKAMFIQMKQNKK